MRITHWLITVSLITCVFQSGFAGEEKPPPVTYPPIFDQTIEDFSLYMAESSEFLRNQAVLGLQVAAEKGTIPKTELLPVLNSLLKDPSTTIRQGAALALSKLGLRSALETLRPATACKDFNTMAAMITARLALSDHLVIPNLKELMRGEDESTGLAAAHVLATLKPPEAAQALLAQIADEKAPMRLRGVHGLRFLKATPASIEALNKALKDPDATVRKATADVLGAMREKSAISQFQEMTADADATVRQAAVNSLGLMAVAAAREIVEKLLESDPDVKVRATAATTLGSMKAWESRNLLLTVAKKAAEDTSVRANALMSLARMGKPEVAADLVSMLQDPLVPIRQATLNATAQLSEPQLIGPLRKVLIQDTDMRCRASAAYQLGKLKAKEAEEDLIKAWTTNDGGLRLNILSALQNIGSVRIIEFAEEAVSDKNGGLRQSAISVLANLKHKPAAEEVLAIATKDKDGGMRIAAMRALPALAPTVDSCELLLNALADPAEQIRSTAYTALCSITKQNFPFRSWAYPHRREVEVAKWRDWWTKEGKAAVQAMQN